MSRISEKQFREIQKRMKEYCCPTTGVPVKTPEIIGALKKSPQSRVPVVDGAPHSSSLLKIFFPIVPQPKQRARTFVADLSGRDAWAQAYFGSGSTAGKRVMRTVTTQRTRSFEKFIRDIALSSMLSAKLRPFSRAVMKFTVFRISGDPSEWPTSVHDGDIDNLEKALSDGMNKIVYEDDRLIVGNHHLKLCSRSPGIEVMLREAVKEDIEYLENIIGGRSGI